MAQLRQLPPINIMEPQLDKNFSSSNVFGTGDYSKLGSKGYDLRLGDLEGSFGCAKVQNENDFYETKPFGLEYPRSPVKPGPTHRGFYTQEFAYPRIFSHGKGSLSIAYFTVP